MNKVLRKILDRHFAHTINGRRIVCREVHTNASQITLGNLLRLEGAGLLTYEDEPMTKRVFGVRGWKATLTDQGFAELSAVHDEPTKPPPPSE